MFRDMVTLANLDTSFLVPCKHCADLMQEGEKFCPTCGKDQSAAVDVDPARQAWDRLAGTGPFDSEFDAGIGLVRPDTLWRAEALRGAAPAPGVDSADTSKRWLLGTAAALTALLVLAVVYDSFLVDPQGTSATGTGPMRGVTGKLDQVKSALEVPGTSAPGEPAAAAGAVTSAPQTPTANASARSMAETTQRECNDTMAALALCQKK